MKTSLNEFGGGGGNYKGVFPLGSLHRNFLKEYNITFIYFLPKKEIPLSCRVFHVTNILLTMFSATRPSGEYPRDYFLRK